MPDISIIIRTKNEERWIGHCLAMIYKQTLQDFEVVLVDNKSDDHTVEIAKRYPIDHFVFIDDFLPGRALNDGIRTSKGKYIVCLSAHCIPKDEFWLENLRKNFNGGGNLAGVYGRQLPLSFTDPVDKRDLLIVFGQEYRIQKKDYFFHNANSMLPRSLWEEFPFDEQVTNIEDRVWGKQVIEAGYTLAYDPDGTVFHHHGLHQGNNPKRAKGVVSILEDVDSENINNLPETMLPGNAKVTAILPISCDIHADDNALNLVKKSISALRRSEYVSNIYLVSDEATYREFSNCNWINRKKIPNIEEMAVDELLQKSLSILEKDGFFSELILYVNYEYLNRPEGIIDKLINEFLHKGLDTVFAAYIDYGHYWYLGKDDVFVQTDDSMKSRSNRTPTYRALYGIGTVTSSHIMRKGKLVGEKVGIIALENINTNFRLR
jgi:rhamnosyltransferase